VTPARRRSIQTHVLGIVVLGSMLPLVVLGIWLTVHGVRTGKDLLRQQLDASVRAIASSAEEKWSFRQGELLLLAGNDASRRVLTAAPDAPPTGADSSYLAGLYRQLARTIPSFAFRDRNGREQWSTSALASIDAGSGANRRPIASGPSVTVVMPTLGDDGQPIGSLEARISLDALVSADSGRLVVPGARLAVRDAKTGVMLTTATMPRFGRGDEVRIGDSTWLVARRTVGNPPLEILVAAPTAPYVAPFERAAQVGLVVLLVVASVALGLSVYLTKRLTRPLAQLAEASASVSTGNLERRVEASGPREVEDLAIAFNRMTESLRDTLAELSQRSALAAVGEFAASLAHEIRNGLTSVRVDLQRAAKKLPPDAPSRDLVVRSLTSIASLNATVTGALRVARGGSMTPHSVDLGAVLAEAAESAAPSFSSSGATLDLADAEPDAASVPGDSAALQQMFVNLLLNSAEALQPGGRTRVAMRRENSHVVVSVSDDGRGIAAADLPRVFEPFYTTRPGGTGLGLWLAKQIAVAHGGELTIASALGEGTTVVVALPADES
jgi:signal transduction histidine kinase